MLRLFVAKNTIAFAPHLALEEAGLCYDVTWVDFATHEQQSADYLAINPKGRVPALITDHGTLTETPAILPYIAMLAPNARLMPDDPFTQARAHEMMGWLAATMHVNHAHKLRGHRWADDPAVITAMQAKVPQTMANSCAHLETVLPEQGWIMGDQYTVADIHLYAICRWLAGDQVNITNYPRLAAHFTAMQSRPAVQRVEAAHE